MTIAPSLVVALVAVEAVSSPGAVLEPLFSPHQLLSPKWAERIEERPLLIVEQGIEFLEGADQSNAAAAAREPQLFVVRQLDAYGISADQMVAIVHAPEHGPALAIEMGLQRPSTPLQRVVESVLHPTRRSIHQARIDLIRAERKRVAEALGIEVALYNVFTIRSADRALFARHGVEGEWQPDGSVDVPIGMPEDNDRLLAAIGVPVPPRPPARTAAVARDTKETRIVATVDLDRAGGRDVHTGVGFFDHMLDQVAAHGGFGLTLAVEGDLHIDPHHSIEDATLALGAALKQALGDRAGIGRYGFVLPMDEAEARISVDLGGRPFSVFEGSFHASHIGEYPTALTAHVFRSLAESMGAAIHVHVTGEDDHHKTEACFKVLGRALRQAIRVEGGDVPSTKGVI